MKIERLKKSVSYEVQVTGTDGTSKYILTDNNQLKVIERITPDWVEAVIYKTTQEVIRYRRDENE
jgi:hypothetical protein